MGTSLVEKDGEGCEAWRPVVHSRANGWNTHTTSRWCKRVPHLGVLQGIACGEVSPQAVPHEDELIQAHLGPPLVQRLDKEVL